MKYKVHKIECFSASLADFKRSLNSLELKCFNNPTLSKRQVINRIGYLFELYEAMPSSKSRSSKLLKDTGFEDSDIATIIQHYKALKEGDYTRFYSMTGLVNIASLLRDPKAIFGSCLKSYHFNLIDFNTSLKGISLKEKTNTRIYWKEINGQIVSRFIWTPSLRLTKHFLFGHRELQLPQGKLINIKGTTSEAARIIYEEALKHVSDPTPETESQWVKQYEESKRSTKRSS